MSPSTHFAILGRQPELGLIELESVLGSTAVSSYGRHALLARSTELNHLGGSIKLGRIIGRSPLIRLDRLTVDLELLPRAEGRLTFGVSSYGIRLRTRELEAFGLALKKQLKGRGSVRLVTPQSGHDLTAAQLKFNGLPGAGFELVLLSDGRDLVLGLTEQVQDIDAYAARDYDRPARSAKVGMLPPKLAQILLNTTRAPSVYDPFCGTGVVLQEALLMGRSASGSDLTPEMIEATTTNLTWLARTGAALPTWSVTVADARRVKLPPSPLAIVSEGYLGPNQTAPPTATELRRLETELLPLYRESLAHWAKTLAPGSEVALCAPAWRVQGRFRPLPVLDAAPALGYTVKVFEAARGQNLIYGRDDQIVGRALILLTKV